MTELHILVNDMYLTIKCHQKTNTVPDRDRICKKQKTLVTSCTLRLRVLFDCLND